MAQPQGMENWPKTAFAVRDELAATASKMEEVEVTRSVGGVTVTLTASGALRAIRIDPKLLSDGAAVERNIVAAHQEAFLGVRQAAADMLGPLRDMVARVATGL